MLLTDLDVLVVLVAGGPIVVEVVELGIDGELVEESEVALDAHDESTSIATTAVNWTSRIIMIPTHHCHASRRVLQPPSHSDRL